MKMHTRTANVSAKLKEQSRSADGQVHYALNVTLDPAGLNGFFKDEILLYTNDSTTPTIPISVAANVRSELTVAALEPDPRTGEERAKSLRRDANPPSIRSR